MATDIPDDEPKQPEGSNEAEEPAAEYQSTAAPSVLELNAQNWHLIAKSINAIGLTGALAALSRVADFQQNHLILTLSSEHSILFNQDHQKQLAAALSNYYGTAITLEVREVEEIQAETVTVAPVAEAPSVAEVAQSVPESAAPNETEAAPPTEPEAAPAEQAPNYLELPDELKDIPSQFVEPEGGDFSITYEMLPEEWVHEWNLYIQRRYFPYILFYDIATEYDRDCPLPKARRSRQAKSTGWIIIDGEEYVAITPGSKAFEEYGFRKHLVDTINEALNKEIADKGWITTVAASYPEELEDIAWVLMHLHPTVETTAFAPAGAEPILAQCKLFSDIAEKITAKPGRTR